MFVFVLVCCFCRAGNPSVTSAPTCIENRQTALVKMSSSPTFVGTRRLKRAPSPGKHRLAGDAGLPRVPQTAVASASCVLPLCGAVDVEGIWRASSQ